MLKRMIVAGVVGAFFVAPPAIAKSSATVPTKAPAAKVQIGHNGQCPSARTATSLDF